MSETDIVRADDKSAHPLELFFDLVFVYAITQIVSSLVHDLTPAGFGKAALVFWMVWWAWSQYAWGTNGSDIDDIRERVGLLAATAVTFFMAQSLPDAFAEGAAWFALPYAATRALSLFLFWIGVKDDPVYRRAFLTYLPVTSLGLVIAGIGGFVPMPSRVWVWLVAIVADLAATQFAQAGDWALKAGHFAERHGLIVIIALGESIIAVGVASSGSERTSGLVIAIGLGVILSCLLWWTYFDKWWETGEHWLAQEPIETRGQWGRNLYSLMHYPLIAGIIALAVAVEEIVAHPSDPLETPVAVALAGGLALYIGAIAVNAYWARRIVLVGRLVVIALVGLVSFFVSALTGVGVLAVVVVAVLAVAIWERRTQPLAHAPA
ncbi:MAG: low temperature requirement protein A [Acidimicrobiia bacterium]|nr:low temperature requirement protein A [Acidimicrobiia bacterium]